MHPCLVDGIRSSILIIKIPLEAKLSQDTRFAVQQYPKQLGGKVGVN